METPFKKVRKLLSSFLLIYLICKYIKDSFH